MILLQGYACHEAAVKHSVKSTLETKNEIAGILQIFWATKHIFLNFFAIEVIEQFVFYKFSFIVK